MRSLQSWLASTTACVVLSLPVLAQSRNVAVLGRYDPGSRGSDVWGYVDRDTGKEYALACAYDGTHVLDCSDPSNPILRGIIPTDNPGSSGNRWRDLKVFGQYAYVVSEAHGGMQIIDLTNPDRPRKVRTFGASLWSATHNIAMDFTNGVAYACGTNNGMHVIDVKTNPTNPTRIAVYTTAYVHDLAIQNGLAHTAEINSNRYTILDVTGLPSFSRVSSVVSAGRSSCHSMWPSRDDQIVAICHETSGGELVVYDISNPRIPVFLSKFQTGGRSAIVHNPMVVDRVCHISWNTEGYQAMDLSDPANPMRVGFYDTWSGSSAGFEGVWGVYAGQPSGVIYAMDRSAGFFVFKPKCTAVRYGRPSGGATRPSIYPFGSPWAGNQNYRIDLEDAPPSSSGVLVLSTAAASVSAVGIEVLVDFSSAHVSVPVVTGVGGDVKVALPVPEPVLAGKLYVQGVVLDATASIGISATQGLEIELFVR